MVARAGSGHASGPLRNSLSHWLSPSLLPVSPGAGEEISSVDAADVVITPSSPLISTTAGSALSEPAAVSVVKSVVSLLSCDVASLHLL